MRPSLHHVDGELYIFGVESKKIFRRFKDDIYKSSHEIWALGTQIIRSIDNAPSMAHQVFLTTRNNFKEDLENYFETISYNLNNFNQEDQIKFLVKYWSNKNKNLDEKLLENYAVKLITRVNLNLNNNVSKLIGIPLQTKMIADIYSDKSRICIMNL